MRIITGWVAQFHRRVARGHADLAFDEAHCRIRQELVSEAPLA